MACRGYGSGGGSVLVSEGRFKLKWMGYGVGMG
jgi:hypothetical protein